VHVSTARPSGPPAEFKKAVELIKAASRSSTSARPPIEFDANGDGPGRRSCGRSGTQIVTDRIITIEDIRPPAKVEN
jgi:hypothetical protein